MRKELQRSRGRIDSRRRSADYRSRRLRHKEAARTRLAGDLASKKAKNTLRWKARGRAGIALGKEVKQTARRAYLSDLAKLRRFRRGQLYIPKITRLDLR